MKIAIVLAAVLACAYAAPNKYIIGGEGAKIEDFPYLVSVQWGKYNTYYHICGGAIIDEYNVITAKHCCEKFPARELFVLAESDKVKVTKEEISKLGEKFHVVEALQLIDLETPESFQDPPTKGADLCVLQLKKPLTNVPKVDYAEITEESNFEKLKLAGWGYKDADSSKMSEEELLQSTKIDIITKDECKENLKKLGVEEEFLHEDNFCTMHDVENESSSQTVCNGDSGGPLVDVVEDSEGKAVSYNLIGIVSWGVIPCGAEGIPSIFTEVNKYKEQISKKLKEKPEEKPEEPEEKPEEPEEKPEEPEEKPEEKP
ncbi:PREDICTED: mite allergen Der f 3-like [Nicrophorus vespilloides]|uniref:Mite allergen Der f 3-like n=1 Tax=Nicrophorus vespilloides TaxID=110193 RepID=A0ABM1M208_NICVS|nr:PREDICTED: mite allergen Der f 3-like [Nicrophorus vespilloides]